jgi:hypothetical protein
MVHERHVQEVRSISRNTGCKDGMYTDVLRQGLKRAAEPSSFENRSTGLNLLKKKFIPHSLYLSVVSTSIQTAELEGFVGGDHVVASFSRAAHIFLKQEAVIRVVAEQLELRASRFPKDWPVVLKQWPREPVLERYVATKASPVQSLPS